MIFFLQIFKRQQVHLHWLPLRFKHNFSNTYKNRKANTIIAAWKDQNTRFKEAGVEPNTYVMDNQTSKDLKDRLQNADIQYQLVPPHIHQTNLSERVIQTFKTHFKAGLTSLESDFPLSEWYRIIEQGEFALNILRTSRSNPKLSAHAYLFSQSYFSATPLVPLETKLLAHRNISIRTSLGLNGEGSWVIVPSLKHCRCIKCYFSNTRSVRDDICTITFFKKIISVPKVKLCSFLR